VVGGGEGVVRLGCCVEASQKDGRGPNPSHYIS